MYQYPKYLKFNFSVKEAVVVLRRSLQAAEDHSIVVVSLGFLNNLADLLLSPPDNISQLTGYQLVQNKVQSTD